MDPNAKNWSEGEHVSEQVQLEAQKLVHLAGNAELAKHAIDFASQVEASTSTTEATSSNQAVPSNRNLNTKFLDSLDQFERLLGLPVINGELLEWVTNVNTSFEKVKALLLDKIQYTHGEVFSRILKEDPDLSSRVEALRAKDNQIAEQELREVDRGLASLLEIAQAVGNDESQISDLLARVSRKALMFVVISRAQETAIAAWLNEAFNRDLGGSG
jgi:hypothetical protein